MWNSKIETLLKNAPDIAAPDGLLEKLQAEIALPEIRRQEPTISYLRSIVGGSRTTNLAAAAAVIVIGTFAGVVYLLARGGSAPGGGVARRSREATVRTAVEQQKQAVTLESHGTSDSERTVANLENGADSDGTGLTAKRGPVMATMGIVPVDVERIKAEAQAIREMAASGDIDGLIEMLSAGMFPSKVAAAEHLGEVAEERALPVLEKLNKLHGSWLFGAKSVSAYYEGSRTSGAFAVAICKILTRDLPAEEQVEAWFDVLEGRGPVMPPVDQLFDLNGTGPVVRAPGRDLSKEFPMQKFTSSFDVGKRVAAELSTFDDRSIVARLRQTENRGAAIAAVWMEVRDTGIEQAIERCMEITRNEGGAQQYGAIQCLGRLGEPAIYALDELALEGHAEAISTCDVFGNNPEVLDILCWHLTNNENSRVRLKVISPALLEPVHLSRFREPSFIQALTMALYDPNELVRRRAAVLLRNAAYEKGKSQLIEYEEELLIALRHPDEEIRPYIAQALKQLGSERLDEKVADPPEIRIDLEE